MMEPTQLTGETEYISPEQYNAWKSADDRRIVYAKGYVARDRRGSLDLLANTVALDAGYRHARDLGWRPSGRGIVHLTQVRLDKMRWAYVATKR